MRSYYPTKAPINATRAASSSDPPTRHHATSPTSSQRELFLGGCITQLNQLTDAGVLAEDKLFATLDPTTRRISLPGGKEVLLTDTVGFIQKLPTHLVSAFRATLEEIAEASVLMQLVDVSSPRAVQVGARVAIPSAGTWERESVPLSVLHTFQNIVLHSTPTCHP